MSYREDELAVQVVDELRALLLVEVLLTRVARHELAGARHLETLGARLHGEQADRRAGGRANDRAGRQAGKMEAEKIRKRNKYNMRMYGWNWRGKRQQ